MAERVGTLSELEAALAVVSQSLATQIAFDELTVFAEPANLVDLLTACHDDPALGFDYLMDVSGVHWPSGERAIDPQLSTTGWPQYRSVAGSGSADAGVIEVTYHLYSTAHNHRVRIVVRCDDTAARVPTATHLYPTADFHEREVYDFFGVTFDGHPNLRRILMPDDWVGHPQRKDYPLSGVDTEYTGASVPPPDQRAWSRELPLSMPPAPTMPVAGEVPT